jgi:hypothetical protein
MAGMAGVGRGDEQPLATSGNERPILRGLQPMMMRAQKIEKVEHGVVGLGPVDLVVAF